MSTFCFVLKRATMSMALALQIAAAQHARARLSTYAMKHCQGNSTATKQRIFPDSAILTIHSKNEATQPPQIPAREGGLGGTGPSGEDMSLLDYQKRHKRIDVALALAGIAAPEFFPCFLLEQTVSGSRLLWSLKDLYDQVIEVPCISTVALLLLVTKWSGKSKSGTTKNPQAQNAWENVLKALVQRCLQEEDWDMAVYLDTAVECKAGFPSKGSRLVKLPVRRGQVDMSAILDCQDAGVHASLSKLTPQPCTVMGLRQWLQLLDCGGRKMQWLFKQVVNLLAERLEAKVGAEFHAGDTAAGLQADIGKQDVLADAEILMTPAEGRASRRRNKFAAGVLESEHDLATHRAEVFLRNARSSAQL